MRRCVCKTGFLLSADLIIGVSFAATQYTGATAQEGRTLVYASVSGPGTLDPYMASKRRRTRVIHNLFEAS